MMILQLINAATKINIGSLHLQRCEPRSPYGFFWDGIKFQLHGNNKQYYEQRMCHDSASGDIYPDFNVDGRYLVEM